jgi:hypothetical protein
MKYFKMLWQLSFHCTNPHCQLCHIKMLNHYFNIKLQKEREKLLKFIFCAVYFSPTFSYMWSVMVEGCCCIIQETLQSLEVPELK